METPNNRSFKYLAPNEHDALWGATVDTVGKYDIDSGYYSYPPQKVIPTTTILT